MISVTLGDVSVGVTMAGPLTEARQYSDYCATDAKSPFIMPGFRASWSLALEEHSCLLFPLGFTGICRRDFLCARGIGASDMFNGRTRVEVSATPSLPFTHRAHPVCDGHAARFDAFWLSTPDYGESCIA
jgi:hypothetical protein